MSRSVSELESSMVMLKDNAKESEQRLEKGMAMMKADLKDSAKESEQRLKDSAKESEQRLLAAIADSMGNKKR